MLCGTQEEYHMARRSLIEHFANLRDPRINRTKKHRLDDILIITLCAMLCGATTFEEIEEFADCRKEWFQSFLALPNGIPSHDTIYRVFCALDASVFAQCFGAWMADLSETVGLKHVAIDGKSLRGTSSNTFTGCVHLVSAWATEQGLILGQESVIEKSNEITAIPILLQTLHLKGVLITIDAVGCQKEIVEQIQEQGGDYLICVKGNQPKLSDAVQKVFSDAIDCDFEGVDYTQASSINDGHGRHEERYVTVITNPQGLPEEWTGLTTVVQVNRERMVQGKNTTTTHYYMSSLKGTAQQLGDLIRRHWAIENELHWMLDVSFGEDVNRTQDRNASANLGVVRRTVVSLMKQNPMKGTKKRKTMRAASNTGYLKELLQGNTVI